jgi:hypothetical protein
LNPKAARAEPVTDDFLAACRDLRAEALAEWEIAIRHLAATRHEAACLYEQIAQSFPAREIVERFGQMGRRKPQMAG